MVISEQSFATNLQPAEIGTERYALLGDVHDARDRNCTRYTCVGDVVGHNANPRECLEILRQLGMPCVKGNHDEYASNDHPLEGLNPRAAAAILWTRQRLSEADKHWLRELKFIRLVSSFSIVHATLDGPHRWGYVFDKWAASASLSYQNTAVCFFGHTHVPLAFIRDSTIHGGTYSHLQVEPGRKYLVNVGSVGEPRDGNALAAYVIYGLVGLSQMSRQESGRWWAERCRPEYSCQGLEPLIRANGR
jgi:predicted phosphodiesterase